MVRCFLIFLHIAVNKKTLITNNITISTNNKIINDDGRLINLIYCSKSSYEREIIYPEIFRNWAKRPRKGSPALPYAEKFKKRFERATSSYYPVWGDQLSQAETLCVCVCVCVRVSVC
jgi:hypothetical protein